MAKSFADTQGRTWNITVTVDTVRRVKQSLDLDLLDILGGEALERIVSDPVLLCDLLYVTCRPQAEQAGVSDEDFGRSLAGDSLDEATTAFLEALTDFFPSRKRAALKTLLAKMRAAEERLAQQVTARLESAELDRQIDAELERLLSGDQGISGAPSGISPDTSASIPAR